MELNKNKAQNNFRKKTIEELRLLPWEQLKEVKNYKLHKLCLNSMSINSFIDLGGFLSSLLLYTKAK